MNVIGPDHDTETNLELSWTELNESGNGNIEVPSKTGGKQVFRVSEPWGGTKEKSPPPSSLKGRNSGKATVAQLEGDSRDGSGVRASSPGSGLKFGRGPFG